MKSILVAMDFSKGAEHALDYAIKIANSIQADIMLVWVDAFQTKESIPGLCKNEIRRDAKLELQRIVEEKSALLLHNSMKVKLRKGKVYQELSLQAKSSDASLIVVGTHGISGYEEFWIGSNAYKIISYAPCPVISVRVDFDLERPIKKIVLPIDNSSGSTKKVPAAAGIAHAFGADIHLLGVYTTQLASLRKKVDRAIAEAEKYLISKNVTYLIEKRQSGNLPLTVTDYAHQQNADMIVIMTDQDKATQSILMGDFSQTIINRSSMPILSVKPENLFN